MDIMTGRFLDEEAYVEDRVSEVGRPCCSRPACWVAEVVEAEGGVAAADFVLVGVEKGCPDRVYVLCCRYCGMMD